MKHFATTLALALWCASMAQAQDTAAGQALFARHCATCHGEEARGNGPMAPALLLQPTDLTRLAAGNSGVFPVMRVVMRIDGRDPLVSHGSPMPVYGEFFEGDVASIKAETGQPIMASRPVIDLVHYLQELQE
ncbi:cytochrome c [Sulfitobacter sp. LCG007]